MKRGSSNQLTKDLPSSPIVMNSGAPQQASAEILAGRKIARPKRFSKSPSVGLQGANAMPNPFANTATNSLAVPQQNQQNAFSSGQMNAFGTTQQPQQASSFTGGFSSGPNSQRSTPQPAFAFTGAGSSNGSMFGSAAPAAAMPAAAAAPNPFPFGNNNGMNGISAAPAAPTPAPSFMFGAGASNPATSGIGGAQMPAPTPMFGANAPSSTGSQSSLFQPKPSGFSFTAGGSGSVVNPFANKQDSLAQPAAATSSGIFNSSNVNTLFAGGVGGQPKPPPLFSQPSQTNGLGSTAAPASTGFSGFAAGGNGGVSTAGSTPSLFANSGFKPSTGASMFTQSQLQTPAASSSASTVPSLFATSKPAEAAPKPVFGRFSAGSTTPAMPSITAGSTSSGLGIGSSLFAPKTDATASTAGATTSTPAPSNIFAAASSGSEAKPSPFSTTPATTGTSFALGGAGAVKSSTAPIINAGGLSFGSKAGGSTKAPTSLFSQPTGLGIGAAPTGSSLFSMAKLSETPGESAKSVEQPKQTAVSTLFAKPAEADKSVDRPDSAMSHQAASLTGDLDAGAVSAFKQHPSSKSVFTVVKSTGSRGSVGTSSQYDGGSLSFVKPSSGLAANAFGLRPSAPSTAASSVGRSAPSGSTTQSAGSPLGPPPKLSFSALNRSLLAHLTNADVSTDWSPMFLHYLRTVLESGLCDLGERRFPPKTAFDMALQPRNPGQSDRGQGTASKRRHDDTDDDDEDERPAKRTAEPESQQSATPSTASSARPAAKPVQSDTPKMAPPSQSSKSKSQTASLFSSIIGGTAPNGLDETDRQTLAVSRKAEETPQPSPFAATWVGKPPSRSIFPDIANAAGAGQGEPTPASATHPAFMGSLLGKAPAKRPDGDADTSSKAATSLFAGFGVRSAEAAADKDSKPVSVFAGASQFSSLPTQPKLGGKSSSLFFKVDSSTPTSVGSGVTHATGTSTATGDSTGPDDEEAGKDSQIDLSTMEEEKKTHDALFEAGYARLQTRTESNKLEVGGTGRLGLLRKTTSEPGSSTGKTRVLFKTSPSGRVLVNGWLVGAFARVGKKSAQGAVLEPADGGMRPRALVFNFQSADVADQFVATTKASVST